MSFLRQSVLALRVLGWVLLASLAVFALASALGLAYEHHKTQKLAHANAHDAAQRSLPAVSNALWQYDVAALDALLTGLVTAPVVVRAQVLAPDDKPVSDVRQHGFDGPTDRVWSLPILAHDGRTVLGSLHISESYAPTRAQLMHSLGILAATDLAKILALALIIFVIVYRKVARHLQRLAHDVSVLGHGTDAPVLTLGRKHHSNRRDEIDILVDAINGFVAERKAADQAQRIAACAFESQQGIAITDAKRVILRVNQAFTQITGYSADEAVGQTPRLLSSGRQGKDFYDAMNQALQRDGAWSGEIWNRRKSGEIYPEWLTISVVKNPAGAITHYVGIFTDLSEHMNAQAQIANLAYYDPLTQLPNRRMLLDRLDQALHTSSRHHRHSALLFVDLDNFKTLNDTLGHHQGDLVLAQVAQRLKGCLRDGDMVARLGSDEFVVMLENLSEDALEAASAAETVGTNILKVFEAPFLLDMGEHRATPSIGITLFGGATHEGSEQPLQRAELAMFQAKAAGRNALRFFDNHMQAEVQARAALEADLREALERQQLTLHYQPQVVGADRITGVEALLRWHHPTRGMVSPATFIPLAEETGLILPIGQWVLEQACSQLAAWTEQPALAHLSVAVNVSARQVQQGDFVQRVQDTLQRTRANPHRLKLELTESMLVDDVQAIIARMAALKALGVGFALDDFGTGYSSLAYLKRLPLDQLKIDQGFVRNIVTDPNDAAIAKMVIVLAESLGLAVIAEGVELQAQADFLAHLGCHAYQGYLFSKPLPVQELEARIRQGA